MPESLRSAASGDPDAGERQRILVIPTAAVKRIGSILALALALAGCHSVEWKQVPPDLSKAWQARTLFNAEHAWVLARDEGTAAEAYVDVEEMLRHLAEGAGVVPGKGLVIAVASEDPPLFDAGPVELVDQLGRWHSTVVDVQDPSARSVAASILSRTKELDGTGLDRRLIAKLAAGGVPATDTVLQLPNDLLQQVDWVIVMPTRSCIEAVISKLIDAGFEKADLNVFERTFAGMFVPSVSDELFRMVHDQTRMRLLEVCFRGAGKDFTTDSSALLAAIRHAKLSRGDAMLPLAVRRTGKDGIVRIGGRPFGKPQAFARASRTPGIVFPLRNMPAIAVSEPPTADDVRALAEIGFGTLVDLTPDGRLATVAQNGLAYVHVPISGSDDLDRANVDRVARELAKSPAMALVCGDDRELAAAIVALKAHWIDGKSGTSAMKLGRHLGLKSLAARVSLVARETMPRGMALTLPGDGSSGFQHVLSCPDGGVVVAGEFQGAMLLPGAGSDVAARGGDDLFVARFEATGELGWFVRVGSRHPETLGGLARLANGDILVAGNLSGEVDVDPGPERATLTAPAPHTGFLACYSVTGRHKWSRVLNLRRISMFASAGRVAIVGRRGEDSKRQEFLSMRDEDGRQLFERRINSLISRVSIAADGRCFVVSHEFYRVPSGNRTRLQRGFALTALDASGTQLWRREWRFEGYKNTLSWPRGLLRDAQRNLIVVASLEGSVDLDPGPREARATSSGEKDVVVLRFSEAGEYLGHFRLAATKRAQPTAATLDAAGNLCIAGTFAGTMDFAPSAGQSLATDKDRAASSGAFVATYEPTGRLVWSRTATVRAETHRSPCEFRALAVAPDNTTLAAGRVGHRIEIDGQAITPWAANDALLVVFDSHGRVRPLAKSPRTSR